jgi:hypothetical protein
MTVPGREISQIHSEPCGCRKPTPDTLDLTEHLYDNFGHGQPLQTASLMVITSSGSIMGTI